MNKKANRVSITDVLGNIPKEDADYIKKRLNDIQKDKQYNKMSSNIPNNRESSND